MERNEEREILIPAQAADLKGVLHLPEGKKGIVVFAHGSGRFSPRNQFVARFLHEGGIATLLVDLLTDAKRSC